MNKINDEALAGKVPSYYFKLVFQEKMREYLDICSAMENRLITVYKNLIRKWSVHRIKN